MQIDMKQPILDKNDRLAQENRALFAEKRVFVLDLLASPGSGKRLPFWPPLKRCATSSTSPLSKAISRATSMRSALALRALLRCKSTRVARAILKAT